MALNVRVEVKPSHQQYRGDVVFLYRKFKKECDKAGILKEVRERQYHVKPGEYRRRKKYIAQLQRRLAEQDIETPKKFTE